MRRADRLFQIVQFLRGGRLVTASDLAEKLEVSTRTIYRDIVDLQSTGVPIDGEAGVGYVMQDGYELPPLMFTRDEIVALVAGARLVKAWGGATMAHSAEEALVKIDAMLPDDVRRRTREVPVHSIAPEMDDFVRRALDRIEKATDASVRLAFSYASKGGTSTSRTIRPLGLWFWGKVWTVVGWCELREDFRTFRVDRMSDLEEGARFRPEKGRTLRDFYASPDPGRPDVLDRVGQLPQ